MYVCRGHCTEETSQGKAAIGYLNQIVNYCYLNNVDLFL